MEAQIKSKPKIRKIGEEALFTFCVFNLNIYTNRLNSFLKHADFTLFYLEKKLQNQNISHTNQENITINQVLDTPA